MKQYNSQAIVLNRINYQETDRILTVLTADYGKLRLIAKGSRSMKSKLAGGIELFAINDIGFIRGRGDIATLISGRLKTNYPNILTNIKLVQLGYEFLKIIDRNTEDRVEIEYFNLLSGALAGLNNLKIPADITNLWFLSRLIAISGHMPNLISDTTGADLIITGKYRFDDDAMAFIKHPYGIYDANHIKFLRLSFSVQHPSLLYRVGESQKLTATVLPLVRDIRLNYLYS
jgi:DNA repair protein RecO (recombination protein O)